VQDVRTALLFDPQNPTLQHALRNLQTRLAVKKTAIAAH